MLSVFNLFRLALGKGFLALFAAGLVLSACQTTDLGRMAGNLAQGKDTTPIVGPQLGQYDAPSVGRDDLPLEETVYLDVVIPVFDPGIPANVKDYEEEGIWPELRRAEAMRFAWQMKLALEETGKFGSVRVVPDNKASGDLYVLGKITESDSEDVDIDVVVLDSAGRKWMDRSFDHTVVPAFHQNQRNAGKDAYYPVFDEAAIQLVEEMQDYNAQDLQAVKSITEIRFAQVFAPEQFSRYTVAQGSLTTLASLPSENDPMLHRIAGIKEKDDLFIDRLQDEYSDFYAKTDAPYQAWQQETLPAVIANRAAKQKAAVKAGLGVALIIGMALVGENNPELASAAITTGIIGGAALMQSGLGDYQEGQVHKATINEMGKSLDLSVGPQVIAVEDKTVELTGTATEQYIQWRAFLTEIIAVEQTPETML